MTGESVNPAIKAAREAQKRVDACLDAQKSFRLEAGAGAGKTYSLVSALKRIIADRGHQLVHAGQKVACITYTEVARREIAQEIEDHPAILVATIHAFSWGFMRQFQKALRELVSQIEEHKEELAAAGGVGSKSIEYDLGFFGVDQNRITLSHDLVPSLMAKLLEQKKFRLLFSTQFPVLFIDEYQDTDPAFMGAINDHFLAPADGPLVGLFGDHWQTIYRGDYEIAKFPVQEIGKGSNFRSVKPIVDVLNQLRPELPQEVCDPLATGEARFFHTNQYAGDRVSNRNTKDELPPEVILDLRTRLMRQLEQEGWDMAKTKVLMLTHNVLAAEQGYPGIAEVFKGRSDFFARKEDPAIKFFAETLEPVCAAYEASRYGEMFRILGSGPTIERHADKISWRRDMDALQPLRSAGTVGDVLDHLKLTRRPRLPDKIVRMGEELASLGQEPIPEDKKSLRRHLVLRQVPYKEVVEVVRFVEGQTPFATQHSVKGAEFENVLVVLGGGWNHYNWPQLFELLETQAITDKNEKGFYRARNLFYVSISRPMKRLAVFSTQKLSDSALSAIERLFGAGSVVALPVP